MSALEIVCLSWLLLSVHVTLFFLIAFRAGGRDE